MRTSILQRIISKGGLYGTAAQLFGHDEMDGNKLIVECFEQCRNRFAVEFWGKELVADIVSYRVDLLRQSLRTLLDTRS